MTQNDDRSVRHIYIFGCGGSGREILRIVRDLKASGCNLEAAAFVVDAKVAAPTNVHGLRVLRGLEHALKDEDAEMVIGIGAPSLRRDVARRIQTLGLRCATLVHPTAWIGEGVSFAEGVVVYPHSAITSDVRLGAHVHVNVGASVSHDCELSAFVTLAPGVRLAGHVRMHEGAECGVGASVIPRVHIGRWSMVGGGAAVTTNVSDNAVVAGVPAKELRRRADGWHELIKSY
jgi:sugar O-acyltransferase (sialic acid O-acetyltransferase NeuD family)